MPRNQLGKRRKPMESSGIVPGDNAASNMDANNGDSQCFDFDLFNSIDPFFI